MNHLKTAARRIAQAHARQDATPTPARAFEVVGDVACVVQVWRAAAKMPTSQSLQQHASEREGCRADIIEAVRYAGEPVGRKEILTLLREAGEHHGAGTVAKALADLTATGELVNRRDGRGYRLPEWDMQGGADGPRP